MSADVVYREPTAAEAKQAWAASRGGKSIPPIVLEAGEAHALVLLRMTGALDAAAVLTALTKIAGVKDARVLVDGVGLAPGQNEQTVLHLSYRQVIGPRSEDVEPRPKPEV